LIAGAKKLIEHRDALNRINVFPVADADTGANSARSSSWKARTSISPGCARSSRRSVIP
jgi:dihydroxyacetone kinase-like predicted kinase